ncbi:hypothetical protein HDV06_003177 [Boothiomyces sp. JEL0866]|nr:hypothetical protein HDV06_003177 [Boothiomyces sp. JEL0866]
MPRKRNCARVRKPMNAFFYYRSQFKDQFEESCSTTNSNEISKVAAVRWKDEPEDVKKIYREMSKKAYDAFKLKKKKVADTTMTPRMILPKRKAKMAIAVPRLEEESTADIVKESNLSPVSDSLSDSSENESYAFNEQPTSPIKQMDSTIQPEQCYVTVSFDELVISFIREFDPTYQQKIVDFEDLVESCLKEFNPLHSYRTPTSSKIIVRAIKYTKPNAHVWLAALLEKQKLDDQSAVRRDNLDFTAVEILVIDPTPHGDKRNSEMKMSRNTINGH